MKDVAARDPARFFWGILWVAAVLFPSTLNAEVTGELLEKFQPAQYESDGESISYRLMVPATLQENTKYPLVLFLHGAGERGDDNKVQLVHAAEEFARDDRRQDYPAYVLFPQCPKNQRWVESDWDLPSGHGQFATKPTRSMKLTLELVDKLAAEHPIDLDRLYVTGLSMGGQGAWFAAVAAPKRFAAMVEVCGGGDPAWAAQYAGTPVWAFHGQDDSVVPISRAREMVVALTRAGHYPELRYVEYPKVGHNSWTRTFQRDDLFRWLFAQHRQ